MYIQVSKLNLDWILFGYLGLVADEALITFSKINRKNNYSDRQANVKMT